MRHVINYIVISSFLVHCFSCLPMLHKGTVYPLRIVQKQQIPDQPIREIRIEIDSANKRIVSFGETARTAPKITNLPLELLSYIYQFLNRDYFDIDCFAYASKQTFKGWIYFLQHQCDTIRLFCSQYYWKLTEDDRDDNCPENCWLKLEKCYDQTKEIQLAERIDIIEWIRSIAADSIIQNLEQQRKMTIELKIVKRKPGLYSVLKKSITGANSIRKATTKKIRQLEIAKKNKCHTRTTTCAAITVIAVTITSFLTGAAILLSVLKN